MSSTSELPDVEKDELSGYTDMSEFTKDGFKILVEAIRNSNALPAQRDYSFYSTHKSFKKIMSNEGNHIMDLMNKIMKSNGIHTNIKTNIMEHKTELLIEANDVILEKVSNNIDEMNGIRKSTIEPIELKTVSSPLPISGSWNKSVNSNKDDLNKEIRLLTAKNIIRPQEFFTDKIDNSNQPWEPRIKEKPNSLKPLAIFLEDTNRGEEFSHPYEFELNNFNPSDDHLTEEEPTIPKPLEETELIEVSTPEILEKLVEDLRKYKKIAVDLEHHSYRTFMGITCLMQISTGDTDYIVDTLALRDKLYVLNEIFTKPSILKVFHGADSDILWLQRDLSLYIVNMFDTNRAAKLLEYSSLSLAYLLERFCRFKPNKHFQLADWRIRPLPDVLKKYAREDTHYLLYIYQMLKKELLKKAKGTDRLLRIVHENSNEVCKQKFFKQRLTVDSHLDLYRVSKRMFDNRQMYALKELYKWRDHKARELDESTGYVLPNHMLLQISETLPREIQGISACCNPIPHLVRANLLELHRIILKAREMPLDKPIMQEDTRARGNTKIQKLNIENLLHCPHDLTKIEDFRDDLPTLINCLNKPQIETCAIERNRSVISIFDNENKTIARKKSMDKRKFLAPFERYQFVKPFIQEEERKINAEKQENLLENTEEQHNTTQNVIDDINENLKNIVKENSTETERLDSIKNYFKTLTQKTQQDEETAKKREEKLYKKASQIVENQTKTLIEMGGSKKRKWVGETVATSSKINFQDPKPESTIPPNKKVKIDSNSKGNKKRWKKQKANNFNNKNVVKIEVKQENEQKQQRGEKRKREASNFEGFDYSSVDFRQFQGGAGSVNHQKNIKSKFKVKRNKGNVNKDLNRSHMFRNSRGGKK